MRDLILGCALLAALVSCVEPEATPFSRGQEIPLGPYTLRVASIETVDASTLEDMPLGRLPRAGSKVISVFVRWKAAGSMDPQEQSDDFLKTLILGRFTLLDGAGKRYWPNLPLPADTYRAARAEQQGDLRSTLLWMERQRKSIAEEWVMFFALPQDSSDLTLVIKNSDAREGQPLLAAVPLGR